MNTENVATEYGSWVANRMIYVSAVLSVAFLGLSILHWGFLIGAALFLVALGYFLYARHAFSPAGRDI